MRSSISSSEKDYILKIIVFFALVTSTYLFINIASFKVQPGNADSETGYVNDVSGKNVLLKNSYPSTRPDIIFVGSSTTKYHVSTNMFKSKNIRMFNYGIESHFFTAYPSMIENAIKAKPRIIALSIDSPELYYPLLFVEAAFNKGINITLENLRFFISHYIHHLNNHIEMRLILRMLQVYFEQLNYFSMNGYIITQYIQTTYNHFNPVLVSPIDMKATKSTAAIDNKYIDCELTGNISKKYLKCVNGDGIIQGIDKNTHYEYFNKRTEYIDHNYNYVLVSILNDMLDKMQCWH